MAQMDHSSLGVVTDLFPQYMQCTDTPSGQYTGRYIETSCSHGIPCSHMDTRSPCSHIALGSRGAVWSWFLGTGTIGTVLNPGIWVQGPSELLFFDLNGFILGFSNPGFGLQKPSELPYPGFGYREPSELYDFADTYSLTTLASILCMNFHRIFTRELNGSTCLRLRHVSNTRY